MKFIFEIWVICISSIRAQWFIGRQLQISPNIYFRPLTIQNNDGQTFFNRNLGRAEPNAYDKYIEEILKQKNISTPGVSEISDKSNTTDRIQTPYESDESSSPVRFIGMPKTDVEPLNNITYAITTFAINVMKSINQLQNGNIIVSPTSITTVLALLQQGTIDETQNEITRALQMPASVTASTYQRLTSDMKKRNSRNILTLSNNLFIGDGFEINPNFRSTAIQNFGSEVTPIDFSNPASAVRQMNKWVSIQTHNKITNLLAPDAVKYNTQLVIVNAVYFKGLWETKFKQKATKQKLFHLSNGQTKTVPFMRMRHSFRFGIDEETESLVAVLPFERLQYSLVMILPHKSSDVDTVLNSLTNTKLVSYQKLEEIEIKLAIPKFTMRSDTDLIPVLKNMGVSSVFSRNSDLTGIGNYRTYSPEISRAFHTGYLSVDELGLSATGASGFAAVALSYEEPSNVFLADRPFLAVLWNTKFAIPLFIARVDDPSI